MGFFAQQVYLFQCGGLSSIIQITSSQVHQVSFDTGNSVYTKKSLNKQLILHNEILAVTDNILFL